MSYSTTTRTNITQNQEDFKLSDNQPLIFKRGLFIKELDPIQQDPTQPRTVTVSCTYKNYNKKFLKQRVSHATSNYISHYKHNHKLVSLGLLDNDISSISDYLSSSRAKKRELSEFNNKEFRVKILNFILQNNLSFRLIDSPTFKELLRYLKEDIPTINRKILRDELDSVYLSAFNSFKNKLNNHKENQGTFSLTLDAWTASNQDAYLGITIHFIILLEITHLLIIP
ncbi:hypothetical protein BKA61DRAFT_578295 [Leptodontidium sp. MPI-SDFR-AT-0119]|nr:hypothetical protein BKA61DRAFT_578295 [Leptodontidium sp. MPI-SDFR-AT-0119]